MARTLTIVGLGGSHDPTDDAALLIESCYAADGLVWASPMYQGTISGASKNALDWLHVLGDRDPPFLHEKVIGLISAAGGTEGLQAINTMEFAVRALRGWGVRPPSDGGRCWSAKSSSAPTRGRSTTT